MRVYLAGGPRHGESLDLPWPLPPEVLLRAKEIEATFESLDAQLSPMGPAIEVVRYRKEAMACPVTMRPVRHPTCLDPHAAQRVFGFEMRTVIVRGGEEIGVPVEVQTHWTWPIYVAPGAQTDPSLQWLFNPEGATDGT